MKRSWETILCVLLTISFNSCRTNEVATTSPTTAAPVAPASKLWEERFPFQWDKNTIKRAKFSARGNFASSSVFEFHLPENDEGEVPKKLLVACQDVRDRSDWRLVLDIGFVDISST